MRVEPALVEDAHAIAAVHVASWRAAYAGLLRSEYLASLSVAQREAMWKESLERGTPQLLVARSEREVVGFCAFGSSRDEGAMASCAEVWAFYLDPNVWSRGVGRTLWLAALARMREQGFKSISLWVIANNERAIRFYRAAGFGFEEGSLKEFVLGGTPMQEVRLFFQSGG
jgi:ribosomal protein S18 acetylase RimI-like enzyme